MESLSQARPFFLSTIDIKIDQVCERVRRSLRQDVRWIGIPRLENGPIGMKLQLPFDQQHMTFGILHPCASEVSRGVPS